MTIPTVRLIDLVPDGCNFKDKTFETYVHRWMERNMPSIPIGLLDTDSESALERWQIEADAIHTVERVMITIHECDECGTEHHALPDEPCCTVNEQGSDDGMVNVKSCTYTAKDGEYFVVHNDTIGEYLSTQRYVRGERLSEDVEDLLVGDESGVLGWLDESDARDAAEAADKAYNSEHGHESSYGFPWAHSWAFMPDGYITDASLKAAGFRVATYCGGSGNWRTDQEFRLAGIDGGGYSFTGSHFARLVAAHHEGRNVTVETDQGLAYITTDTRNNLEILAESWINNSQ